jgi:hypothetical protein
MRYVEVDMEGVRATMGRQQASSLVQLALLRERISPRTPNTSTLRGFEDFEQSKVARDTPSAGFLRYDGAQHSFKRAKTICRLSRCDHGRLSSS